MRRKGKEKMIKCERIATGLGKKKYRSKLTSELQCLEFRLISIGLKHKIQKLYSSKHKTSKFELSLSTQMMDDDEDLKKDSKFKIVLVGDGSSGKVSFFS